MSDDPTWPARPTEPPLNPVPANPYHEIELNRPVATTVETMGSGFAVGRVVALVIGLAFLVGVGALAVAGFSGDRAGEESPEAAVDALASALENEDVVAALEVMAPSEVGTASELYPQIVDLAVKEGELQSTDWLAGIDFTVTGLETRTRQLHDGVALVELVSGTISVTVDPDVADPIFLDGPLEDSITIEEMRAEMSSALADAEEMSSDPFLFPLPFTVVEPEGIFIMTVERNGGWFVSPLYTLAEYGRQILDLPAADFSASRENAVRGADDARAVIDDIVAMINDHSLETHVDAALSGDPDGIYDPMWAFVPPDEVGVFLDYAPSYTALFENFMGAGDISMEEIQAEIRAVVDEVDLRGQLRLDIDVREERRPDGTVALYLGSGTLQLDAAATDPDSRERVEAQVSASWDGLCGRADVIVDGVPEESVSDCVPTDVLPRGFDEVFIVVGEVDGDFYISYVETALAYAEIFIEHELND